MLRYTAVLALFALVPACDDTCEPKPLEKFCSSDCPATPEQAIASLCGRDGGNIDPDGWVEGENSCGGTNIEAPGGPWGVIYSFDRAGKLVGGTYWSDTPDGPCDSFDTNYGRVCSIRASTSHDCPNDAGSQ